MAEDDGEDTARAIERAQAGSSLTERLGRGIKRLSWQSPVHRMRLSGRYPLQLIDVPADPIPGRVKAGRALIEGRLQLGQEQVPIDTLDQATPSPALAAYYQSFAWARDLAAAAPREQGAPVAEAIARKWLVAHATSVSGEAWRPDLWGARMLFWTAYAPYLLGTPDQEYRKAMLNALARGARHLDRAADSVPPGLPRVTAWAGVIAAGLLIPGGDVRTAHGEAGIARALAQALHDDGGLATRVPAMQLALVELLAQLRGVYEVRARPLPGAIVKALGLAVPALLGTRMGDGALSSWQGGAPGQAQRIETAVAATGVRAAPLLAARAWGYQKLAAGTALVVMDAAPPPPGALVKDGCASTLAFELSDGRQRLVVNCGSAPGLPADLAQGLRTTAAHSTLSLADTNSTALHPDGSLGKGVSEVALERGEARGEAVISAAHDGYVRRHGFRHERRLVLGADGRLLSGEDRLAPAGRKRGLAATQFRDPLPSGPRPGNGADRRRARRADPAGGGRRMAVPRRWRHAGDRGQRLDRSARRPRGIKQLVVSGETPPDGASVQWSFRKVR